MTIYIARLAARVTLYLFRLRNDCLLFSRLSVKVNRLETSPTAGWLPGGWSGVVSFYTNEDSRPSLVIRGPQVWSNFKYTAPLICLYLHVGRHSQIIMRVGCGDQAGGARCEEVSRDCDARSVLAPSVYGSCVLVIIIIIPPILALQVVALIIPTLQ